MATCKTEKYSKIGIILFKGCTEVTKRLVMKTVVESTPSGHALWTLDRFLDQNRTSIFKTPDGKKRFVSERHKRLLFPSGSSSTNIEDWDMQLLCFILMEICHLEGDVKMRIESMRKVRNKICHAPDANLTDAQYTYYLEKVTVAIDKCLNIIDDEEFSQEMTKLIQDVTNGKLYYDECMSLMKAWYDSDKDAQKRLEIINDKIDNNQRMTNSRLDQLTEDVKAKLDILISRDKVEVRLPEPKIKIAVGNCSEKENHEVCETLVQMLDPQLSQILPEEYIQPVKIAVKDVVRELMSDGKEISKAELKCVILTIKCPFLDSMWDLWNKCVNGKLTKLFIPVQTSIRKCFGLSDITIEVIVTETEFWRCLDDIVSQIARVNEDQMQVDMQSNTDAISDQISAVVIHDSPEDISDTVPHIFNHSHVELTIRPSSVDQLCNILHKCTSGQLNARLERVSEAFKECCKYDNLSIEAAVDENQIKQTLSDFGCSLDTADSVCNIGIDQAIPKTENALPIETMCPIYPLVKTESSKGPKFETKITDVTVCKGEKACFISMITGIPRPLVYWKINNHRIAADRRFKIFKGTKQRLEILETTQSDGGIIKCYAKNTYGSISSKAQLTIEAPPEIAAKMCYASVDICVNDEIEIPIVKFSGCPKPTATWTKNSIMLEPCDRVEITNNPSQSILIIHGAKEADEGVYKFTVQNKHGQDFIQFTMSFIGSAVAPTFTRAITDVIVTGGDEATFACEINGIPTPDVLWYQNGGVAYIDERHSISAEGTCRIFRIKEAKVSDSGLVECRAKNKHGVACCSANLIVEAAPCILYRGRYSGRCRNICSGEIVKICINFTGCPLPTVNWIKDSTAIHSDDRISITNGNSQTSLTIKDAVARDAGMYMLTLTNKHGTDLLKITLRYEDSVAAPKFVEEISDLDIGEGDEATFICTTSGTPVPKVWWFKDSVVVTNDERRTVTTDGERHIFKTIAVKKTDAGLVQCLARNRFGFAETKAKLIVK